MTAVPVVHHHHFDFFRLLTREGREHLRREIEAEERIERRLYAETKETLQAEQNYLISLDASYLQDGLEPPAAIRDRIMHNERVRIALHQYCAGVR